MQMAQGAFRVAIVRSQMRVMAHMNVYHAPLAMHRIQTLLNVNRALCKGMFVSRQMGSSVSTAALATLSMMNGQHVFRVLMVSITVLTPCDANSVRLGQICFSQTHRPLALTVRPDCTSLGNTEIVCFVEPAMNLHLTERPVTVAKILHILLRVSSVSTVQ